MDALRAFARSVFGPCVVRGVLKSSLKLRIGVGVDAVGVVLRDDADGTCLGGQIEKSTRWMPWHQEAKKDVGACDKHRRAGKRAMTR
jgi:hypothetical protein